MSKKKFVISDTWFNRPVDEYSDMEISEYNKMIIEKWNQTVTPSDDVYVLGGFGITDLYPISLKLNGTIHFLNNYFTEDEIEFINNFKLYVENSLDKKLKNRLIFEKDQIITLNDDDSVLSYFPLNYWYGKETGTFCFHGLVRNSNLKENNVCCCAFSNKFKPLEINEVKEKIENFEMLFSNNL